MPSSARPRHERGTQLRGAARSAYRTATAHLDGRNCYVLTYVAMRPTFDREAPMNVSLTPELERLKSEKVESGLYQTASEVVREALRLLRDRDAERELLAPM